MRDIKSILVLTSLLVLGWAVYAKADSQCVTKCHIDGWGNRVCVTTCQDY